MVKEIQVKFTDEKVTAWGGMKLMKDMLDSIGIFQSKGCQVFQSKGCHLFLTKGATFFFY